ncbi:Cyclin-dependent protein kinase inhibitor SMR15 [Hirschfeldia incana]|nr:Cyclin-dependent protein kinase inhibitor SMR15 [Hirschfeldia incana]
MGLSGKTHHQFHVELHETSEKWAISGISLCGQMKPISLSSTAIADTEDVDVHQDQWPTTPTAASFRIPTVFPCPPPPKKRKASSKFGYSGAREFFSPPDLETVFILKATAP